MTTEDLVGLHPHKAAVLATELRRRAELFVGHATVTFDALVQGMEDPVLATPLCDATEWFAVQARALQHTIDEVVRAFADGPVTHWESLAVWSQPYAAAFDHPEAATDAVGEVARLLPALLASSDEDPTAAASLRELLAAWAGNEVFASGLAALLVQPNGLGVGAVGQLVRLEAEWRRYGSPSEQQVSADARHLFFDALATASRVDLLGFRFDDVRREVQGDDAPITALNASDLLPLGVLFASGATWGTDFLVDAMTQFVRPVNHAFDHGEVVFQDNGFDPRVAVLTAVSADVEASKILLARPGVFDDLFADRFEYGDGGKALGDVLTVGTAPSSAVLPAWANDPDAAAQNMIRFVWWAVSHNDREHALPPLTRSQLGAITARWIASFRKPSYDDDPTLANPLAALDDPARVAFLDYVANDLAALRDLRVAELAWTGEAARRVGGPGFEGRGIGLISNVDRRTSRAARNGLLRNLESEDDRINFDRQIWSLGISVVTLPMSDAVDLAVETGVQVVGGEARPGSTMALDYAKAFPSMQVSDDHKLEQSLLGALWARRDEDLVFAGVPAPPQSITMGEPPHLLPVAQMSAAQFDQWLAWIDHNGLRARMHWEELTVGADG